MSGFSIQMRGRRNDALSELILAARNMPLALFSPIIFDNEGKVWFSGGKLSWWRMRAFHRKVSCFQERGQEFLTGCAPSIPLATIDVIGEFDENYFLYYEDADFCLRAKKAGFQLCMVPKAAVDHTEASRTYARKVYYLVYSGLLFFFKHASGMKAGYMRTYVTIRKLKNWIDCLLFGGEEAALVRQAYVDFFRRNTFIRNTLSLR